MEEVVTLAAHDFGEAVDKDVGNIVVAGIHAADKALQGGVAGNIILAGLYQADVAPAFGLRVVLLRFQKQAAD